MLPPVGPAACSFPVCGNRQRKGACDSWEVTVQAAHHSLECMPCVYREKLRQAELTLAAANEQLHQAEAANASNKKGLAGPVSTFGASTFSTKATADPRSLDMRLAQELIASRVTAESAVRRAELVGAERSRLQQTLAENQVSLIAHAP